MNSVESIRRRVYRHRLKLENTLKLIDRWESALLILKDYPHPMLYFSEKGKTLADYYLHRPKIPDLLEKAIIDAEQVLEELEGE